MMRSTILASKGSATLVDFIDSDRSITDIAPGITQQQITLPPSAQQYSYLEIAVRDVKSDEHTSLYNTYSVDFGRSVLRQIRLERFFVDGVETSLSFDMKDDRDMNVLFQNYLSIHTVGSFSFGAMNLYDQYDQIATLSTRTDYAAAKFNKKIYIDMRPSQGMTTAPDRPMPNNRPMLTLNFNDGAMSTRKYRVTVRCLYPASFKQIQTESLIKPIQYYPTSNT